MSAKKAEKEMTQAADPPRIVLPEATGERGEKAPPLHPTLEVPLVLRIPDTLKIDEEQFLTLCQENGDLRFERNAEGDWIIMPPAGGDTGIKNSELNRQLANWAIADGTGRVFDSSSGFKLPNGAERSPDAAWVLRERFAALTLEQRQRFIPLCPDFVAELRSPSDRLSTLRNKMKEYLANGARLGWLIDAANRHVYVYSPSIPVERLDNPLTISGDPVLLNFVLDAQAVFDVSF
jgi:Uma2 family endonuclease